MASPSSPSAKAFEDLIAATLAAAALNATSDKPWDFDQYTQLVMQTEEASTYLPHREISVRYATDSFVDGKPTFFHLRILDLAGLNPYQSVDTFSFPFPSEAPLSKNVVVDLANQALSGRDVCSFQVNTLAEQFFLVGIKVRDNPVSELDQSGDQQFTRIFSAEDLEQKCLWLSKDGIEPMTLEEKNAKSAARKSMQFPF